MKTISIVACLFAVLIAPGVGFSWDKPNVQAEEEFSCKLEKVYYVPHATIEKPERADLPEYVPYMCLFQYLSAVHKKGRDHLEELLIRSNFFRSDFDQLIALARRYKKEVDEYDRQAKVIIDKIHRQHPPGKLPAGSAPPKPPQELLDLQNRRNNTALKYRDEAKVRVSHVDLDAFIRRDILPWIVRQKNETR